VITLSKRLAKVLLIGSALFAGASSTVVVPAGVAVASTEIFTVNTTADTHDARPGNGVCADRTGKCSLRAAIEEADAEPSGSIILIEVPAGKYPLTLGTLSITSNLVSISGSGTAVLKEKGRFQLMNIARRVTAYISDVVMENGKAGTGTGGALWNAGTTALTSVSITSSKAAQGGAIFNAKLSRLTLTGSTVSNSAAANVPQRGTPGGSGGGILNAGLLTLNGSTVSGNVAGGGGPGSKSPAGNGGNGGGIANTGKVVATGSTITDNHAGPGGVGLNGTEPSGNGGDGGGIYSVGSSTVSLTDSVVEGNTSGNSGSTGGSPSPVAGDGGGIWSGSGASMLTVSATTFTSNTGGEGTGGSGNGGAIFTKGTATIGSSTFIDNSGGVGTGGVGGSGGAIENAGILSLTDSTLSNNVGGAGGQSSDGGNGGGLSSSAGSATLSGDTFNGNAGGEGGNAAPVGSGCGAPGPGGDGGAIYTAATLSMINSTLSGNTDGRGGSDASPCSGHAANGQGAGMAASGGAALVSYSTIADNTDGIADLSGTVEVGGSVVADSTLANCVGTIEETGGRHNLDSGTTCAFNAGSDISDRQPKLDPLADNGGPTQTQALRPRSPAIDAGGTAFDGCPPTDQRGDPRPAAGSRHGACDIGAYEFQGAG
jgi:CSLREA domain-containing protein